MQKSATQRLSDELDRALKNPSPDDYAYGMPAGVFADTPPTREPATEPSKSIPEPDNGDSQRYCVNCMFCRVRSEKRGWFFQEKKTAICTVWRDMVRAEPLSCVDVRASATMCGELAFSYQPRRGVRS